MWNLTYTPEGKVYRDGKDVPCRLDRYGYLRFTEHLGNGVYKTRMVHRQIALSFLPNPDSLPQINHKNGIKTDNRAENLEWVSARSNTRHAWANGLTKAYDRSKPYNREAIAESNRRRSRGI